MICHQYKSLFVHIPKVAGQSIESVFMDLTKQDRSALLLKPNSNPLKGPPRLAHLTASEYLLYDYISQEKFDAYFKFSFVRNPWARLVSEYKFRHQKRYDFQTFLFQKFPQPGDDCYETFAAEHRHVIPQYDFLFDREGNQLVDFIGRFENIQQDFEIVYQQLNLPALKLPHKNKSATNFYEKLITKFFPKLGLAKEKNNAKKRKYTEYYDAKSRDYVASLYAKDIEIFNYRFDN